MRKILPFIFLFICIGKWAFSQSCIPTNLNGSTIVISCNAPCSDIGFQVPHLKTTEDYIVNSIPYNAFAYTGGTVVSSIYIDDKFSPLITMGFPFCFYGQTYNDIVIGSNAVVTFEAICANAANAYTLDVGGVPQPIPYNSPASPAGIGTTYYPRASIMGVYQDIDPANSPLPTRRIEYRVEGTAPCRKFVISYKDIRMFSCNNLIATNQIVLYENTGVVEVYIQDKPVCPTWISGLGIIGVQDFTRTKAVAAPGKNCTAFSESNTGYRFTPSGTNSRYLSSELLDMGGAVIALADTATTVPGILDINFPNICPGPSVTQYIVRTRFSSCPVGPIMENLDTINVVRNNVLPVAVDSVPTTCNTNSGSITITPSAGVAPYTATATGPGGPYNYNGASPIVFSNLPAGMYSIYVTDNFGCDTSFNIEVTAITSLSQTVTSTNTSCAGANDGTITVTPTSGVAPFSATATGPGGPYTVAGPSPLVFTGLPAGTFNITFTDALGCTGNLIRTINQGVGLTAVPSRTNTTCFGGSNGSLTITPTVPGAYTFVLNPGGFTNTTGVFTGLVAGSYQCTFTNASGCSGTIVSLVVLSGPQLTGTHTFTNASCSGAPNGTITVTPTTPGSYTYFLNPGAITNTTGIFTGLIPGTYSVLATNSVGCTFVRSNIVINAGSSLSGTATSGTTTCPGATDGTITVTPATPGTYNYVLTPGGATSTTGTFTGLAPGTYSVLATNTVSGCTFNVSNINVINGTAPTGSATSGTTTCPGATDGTITVTTATPGTYTYVLNPGGATNTTGVFTGLATGTYTATGTNTVSGCIFTLNNINVTNGPALTGSATTNTTTCPGATDGTINVTPATPGTYTYVLSPGGATNTTGIFTALAAGTFSVTATSALGCSFTVNNINVTNGTAPTGNATTNTTTCPGATDGSINVAPATPGTYTYVLNPGGATNTTGVFTGLATGTYTATGTNTVSGCIF
nr:SprB repeat-containing protein [Ferruginibacter sp.]